MIEIEAPDGTVVEFPDGTPDSTITSVMAQNYPPKSTPSQRRAEDQSMASLEANPPQQMDAVDKFMDKIGVLPALKATQKFLEGPTSALAQGATFGFADEAAGLAGGVKGMTSGSGFGAGYDRAVGRERGVVKNFREESPVTATGLEILGGVGAVGPGATAALSGAAQNAPGFLNAIKTGSIYGGLYGAGNAEGGLLDRLGGGAGGAAIGGATAGVAYPVFKALGSTVRGVSNAIQNRFSPERAAQRKLADAVARDMKTPAGIVARLRGLGPQSAIVDAAGENVRGLGRAVATLPGPSKERAAATLNSRAEGQGTRLVGAINRTLSGDDFYAAEDRFLKNLGEHARPLYEEAYKKGGQLVSKKLDSILNRPVMRDALKEAADIAAIQGRRLAPLDPELTKVAKMLVSSGKMDARVVPTGGVGKGISTEAIDDLKRGLDRLIEKETNDLTGKLNKRGFALNELKRQLLREVDMLNPAYKKARQIYGGDAEVLTALRKGREALRLDPEQIARELSGLSEAAKKAYRAGASRALKDVVDKSGDTHDAARKLFGNEMIRKRLRALLPDLKSYDNLAKTLVAESRFSQTRNKILGGSDTAPKLAEQVDLGVPGDIASGRGMISTAINRGLEYLNRPNPEVAKELSKMLFSRNQSQNQQVLDRLVERAAGANASAAQKRAIAGMLLRLTAQQEGTAIGQSQRP